jgi:nitroreductase
MDILEVMRSRRSVRAFKDEPVPRELLEEVLKCAANAPSAINMQPWEIHMVIGDERKRLSRRLLRSFKERRLTCGPSASKPIPEKFIERARRCAEAMTPLAERAGSDFRTYINEGSLDFYSAPAVALFFLDEAFLPDRMTDIGVFVGYLVLSAAAHGLASCPIGLIKSYEDEVKDHLNVADTKSLIVSVALGKQDLASPMNEFRSDRIELKEFVRWID